MAEKWDLTHKWKDNVKKWKNAEKKWKKGKSPQDDGMVDDLELFFEIEPADPLLFDDDLEYQEHVQFIKAMTPMFEEVITGYFEQLRGMILNDAGFMRFNKFIMEESGYQELSGKDDNGLTRYGQISFYNANLRNTSGTGYVPEATIIKYYPPQSGSLLITNMLPVPNNLSKDAVVRTVGGFRGTIRSISQGTSIFFNILIDEYKII